MNASPYHRKLKRVLDRMGGIYTLQDILSAIAEDKMQSFVEGQSWAVTQVSRFPQARVLEIIACIGDLPDCLRLNERILQYARDNDIGIVQAYGRRGWVGDARRLGWKVKALNYVYQREL